MPRRTPSYRRSLLSLVLLGQIGAVTATEYSIIPTARYSGTFYTNRRLTPDEHDDLFGNELSAALDFAMKSDRTSLAIKPRVEIWRFALGRDDLDTDNYYVDLAASHGLTDRLAVELTGAYASDSVLSSEIDPAGSGIALGNRVGREYRQIAPALSYLVTERDQVELGYNYSDTTYDGGENRFSNYRYWNAYVTFSHALSESDNVFVNAFTSEFEPEDSLIRIGSAVIGETTSTTRNYGFIAGYTGVFWETWKATLSAGANVSESQSSTPGFLVATNALEVAILPLVCQGRLVGEPEPNGLACVGDNIEEEATDVGPLVDLKLEKQFEKTKLTASYSRSVSPSSQGAQQTNDDLRFTAGYTFSEKLTGNLGATISELSYQVEGTDADNRAILNLDRTYVTTAASLSWHFDEYWTFSGTYSYGHIDSTPRANPDQSTVAEAHAVGVALTYTGRKFSVTK